MTDAQLPTPTASPMYRLVAGTVMGIFTAQRWDFEVHGLEHVPSTGGVVIAANHLSFWDYFTVARPIYRGLGRPIRILAKQGLFDAPLVGPVMRQAGHIPVRRASSGAADALEVAIDALRAGEVVLVLPEQTVSRSFDLLPFKTGAARMAAAAGVPLVPAASWGSHRFHTVGHRVRPTWRLPVTVSFGPPLHPKRAEDPEAVTKLLRKEVQLLLDAAQATYRDGHLADGAWWQPARLGGAAPVHDDRTSAAWQPEISPPRRET